MRKARTSAASAEQREVRERRDERAFLFDRDLSRCLGEVDRAKWEWALSSCGGDVVRAAHQCGLDGVPPGAKALWGRSAEEARDTYRRWQKRRLRRVLYGRSLAVWAAGHRSASVRPG